MALLSASDEHRVIEVTREGGFAFIPALCVRQRVDWRDLSPAQRQRLCDLINHVAALAAQSGQQAGRGDQRYYRILILDQSAGQRPQEPQEITVPESSAPRELAVLWKNGKLD